jgi:inosine-uridine nucleoside N-ribohydrolase
MQMKRVLMRGAVAALLAGVPVFGAPVKIIFDTDMDSDCDDAGALACLHKMADAGEAEILATSCSARFKFSAPCVEAINRYYGRPDLPIGVPRGTDTGSHIGSKYAETIAREFPGKIKSYDDAPAASDVYRKILAAQPDGSVTIVTVGDVTNLRDLLETKADALSDLAGPELIRRKVARWVCMGGRYPEHLDPHVFGNFKTDPKATVEAVRDWPGTIWFTGLGDDVQSGSRLRDTPANNPVRRVYELYLGKSPTRPSWDLIATVYAVRPDAKFWHLRTKGYNHIFENGTNQWRDEPTKNHVLVELDADGKREVREIIESLMVAPPK